MPSDDSQRPSRDVPAMPRPGGTRALVARFLPRGFVHWYRRRRAIRNYLGQLAVEVYDRQIRIDLEVLEGRIAARREGYYDRLVRDVLERTDLVLQELDRRIEALRARNGNELRDLREQVTALRERLDGAPRADAAEPSPAPSSTPA